VQEAARFEEIDDSGESRGAKARLGARWPFKKWTG